MKIQPGFYEYTDNGIMTVCEVYNDAEDGGTVIFLGDEKRYSIVECMKNGVFGKRVRWPMVDGHACTCNLCQEIDVPDDWYVS